MRTTPLLAPLALTLLALAACRDPTTLQQAQTFYQQRPPEEQPKGGHQTVPAGLTDLRAASCGACHAEIYAEWQRSTHALAWRDPQFQEEIKKSGNRWLCNNCHTPLLNQMETWAVGLDNNDVERPRTLPNPDFNPAFRDEGITCASCHVRDGVIEGPEGLPTTAHPTRKAERFRSETLCLDCHQAVLEYPGKTFTCTFNTGEEWRAGPFGKAGVPCQSCHMPEITRPWAEGAPPRPGRRHFWPGAGIYKVTGFGPPLDLLPYGLFVEADARPDDAPDALRLTLTNRAGHHLPTGDPERFITVTTTFLDAQGNAAGDDTLRIGQQWEWWPAPKKLGDNRLPAGSARQHHVPIPPAAAAWRVRVTSHRITAEALTFHKLNDYPASRLTQDLQGALNP
jgi:hypothetical protein